MGLWSHVFLHMELGEVLACRDTFPSRQVLGLPGCPWVELREDELSADAWVHEPEELQTQLSLLSQRQRRRVVAAYGHSAADGLHIYAFTDGALTRELVFDGSRWEVTGVGVPDWETSWVAQSLEFEEGWCGKFGLEPHELDAIPEPDRLVLETHRLHSGARHPGGRLEMWLRALGVERLLREGAVTLLRERQGWRRWWFGA